MKGFGEWRWPLCTLEGIFPSRAESCQYADYDIKSIVLFVVIRHNERIANHLEIKMLTIGNTLVKTPRELTKPLKKILGPEYKVKRDIWLMVEGENLNEAKRIIESIGLFFNDMGNFLIVLTPEEI